MPWDDEGKTQEKQCLVPDDMLAGMVVCWVAICVCVIIFHFPFS